MNAPILVVPDHRGTPTAIAQEGVGPAHYDGALIVCDMGGRKFVTAVPRTMTQEGEPIYRRVDMVH
jgi:hypothetical protein